MSSSTVVIPYQTDLMEQGKPSWICSLLDHLLNSNISQLLSWARDHRKGMMLAWAMNGLP